MFTIHFLHLNYSLQVLLINFRTSSTLLHALLNDESHFRRSRRSRRDGSTRWACRWEFAWFLHAIRPWWGFSDRCDVILQCIALSCSHSFHWNVLLQLKRCLIRVSWSLNPFIVDAVIDWNLKINFYGNLRLFSNFKILFTFVCIRNLKSFVVFHLI